MVQDDHGEHDVDRYIEVFDDWMEPVMSRTPRTFDSIRSDF